MQSSAMSTVTIPSVKAPRPAVGNEPLNPSGRQMRAHEREMEARLERALADWQRRIFRGVTDDTAVLLIQRIDRRDVWQPMQEALEAELLRVASAGVEHAASVFNRVVLGVKSSGDIFGVLWDLANVDASRWARQYSFLLIRDLVDSRRRFLQQEIAGFAENSLTINQLGQRLARFFNADRAKTIAITETTRAFARGNMAAWQQQDIIKEHRWNTANDELVCPICGPLSDQTTKIGAPFPNSVLDSPPAHPRCRCWLTPVVELGVEEAGQDAPAFTVPRFNSAEEARAWARDNLGLDYGTEGISLSESDMARLVNDHNEYLASYYAQHSVPRNIKNITFWDKSGGRISGYGDIDPETLQRTGFQIRLPANPPISALSDVEAGITASEVWRDIPGLWNDNWEITEKARKMFSRGFTPTNAREMLVHELGHAHFQTRAFEAGDVDSMFNEWRASDNAKFSAYATTNSAEFLAESFVELSRSGTVPTVSGRLLDLLTSVYRGMT